MNVSETAEGKRMAENQAHWKKWGPYLSERAWGTVREDYSAEGDAWDYFPHDHARSRAYRWNEDGLGGFCDNEQRVCLAVALWNERDPILKERLFGLTGPEGNHGEDVKEYYFYLDGLPTHAYMKMLYKYPQVEYPYALLVDENARRGRGDPEYELMDALQGAFSENRYFDVFIEYAKDDAEDILCRITAINRGPDPAPVHILPHIWYRNTWSWTAEQPHDVLVAQDDCTILARRGGLGERWWTAAAEGTQPPAALYFTENETNVTRLYGGTSPTPFFKDGIQAAVVEGRGELVNPERRGSKAAAHFRADVPPGAAFTVRVQFNTEPFDLSATAIDEVFQARQHDADEYYAALQGDEMEEDERRVHRQALAGILWSKQFYHYNVAKWLQGDPSQPPPPEARKSGRNADWAHLDSMDVLSMPDKWEYPWFAAWDLAFHTLSIALVDRQFAKDQLILLLREWYMHPNGQIPAYEWSFGDVNPPVHAWAAWQVYQIDRAVTGHGDTLFLERVFHKLLLNFTWWVNRKDADGNNVFQGGFLGLDNIGVFDRSQPLPTGGSIDQADGTAWMAMYCINMLAISLELAKTSPAYEDVATKFFEHFIYIANALGDMGGQGVSLWDPVDGFYYDVLHTPDNRSQPLKVRSFVGLIPLFAVETLEPELLERLPNFRRRLEWFLEFRPNLVRNVASLTEMGAHGHYQLAIVGQDKLARILRYVFDPNEFLSGYGLRALSKYHAAHPYEIDVNGMAYTVRYEPAESSTRLFGGNSNWRGPIWMPINYLMIESLYRHGHHYGNNLTIPAPDGSGQQITLTEAAADLSRRLTSIFLRDPRQAGNRPVFGGERIFQADPNWHDNLLFYEYYHGDNGAGLGASHQTGWSALVANLLQGIPRRLM